MKFSLCALALGSLLVASVASAEDVQKVPALLAKQEVQFSYTGFRSAYSCDYAESQTEQILEDFGAEGVKVRCTGGLETGSNMLSVYAEFTSLRETTSQKSVRLATLTPVILKFDESCDFNETIVKNVLKGFEVYDQNIDSSCFDWQGRLAVEAVVLK